MKASGVSVVIAAAGGLAFLVWAVLVTGEPDGEEPLPIDLADLTVEEAYSRIEEAITQPGFVFHTILETTAPREGGQPGQLEPFYTKEFWIDMEREALREEFRLDPSRAEDFQDLLDLEMVLVVVDGFVYQPDDPSEALRFEAEESCPGTSSAVLARFLECGDFFSFPTGVPSSIRLETAATYEDSAAVAIVFGAAAPDAEVWLYLDAETFLPVARVGVVSGSPEAEASLLGEYRNEFIPSDPVVAELVDPHSIGYGADNEDTLLDEIAEEVPVYWLGSEFQPEGGFDSLVLVRIPRPQDRRNEAVGGVDDPGMAGWLVYNTPRGLPGVHILLWRPEEWETFLGSEMGSYLTESQCAAQSEKEWGGRQATVYTMPQLQAPLIPESLGACAGRISYPTLTLTTVVAVLDLGDVIVDVRPDPTSDFRSLAAIEAVVQGLRAR